MKSVLYSTTDPFQELQPPLQLCLDGSSCSGVCSLEFACSDTSRVVRSDRLRSDRLRSDAVRLEFDGSFSNAGRRL